MKKFKNILLPLTMVLVIIFTTACSDGSKTKTFVKNSYGQEYIYTYTYNEKDDKVLKITASNEIKYGNSKSLVKIKNKEEAEQFFDSIEKGFNSIKGIKYSADYKEDRLTLKMELDFKNIDYKEVNKFLGFYNNKDISENGITMKQSEEALKALGFTEKK